jgi:hypothetical protein
MKEVDTQAFIDLQQEIISAQSQVPSSSLDWNIYQGQLDLLDKVANLINVSTSKIGKTVISMGDKVIGGQG